jgi:hypothetical protein
MGDTTFSIELQGFNLPDGVKKDLESQLRSVVLAEIAKVGLGKEVSVGPLPGSSERDFLRRPPILGFILQNTNKIAERGAVQPGPNPLFAPPDSVKTAQALSGSATSSSPPFDGALPADALEALYYRPDVRAAIASNSQAFAELLSRDEQAAQAFNQLTGGIARSATGTERDLILPFPVIIAISNAATAIVNHFLRK